MGIYFGKHENGAKPSWSGGQGSDPFSATLGAREGTGTGQGSSHTCRQEEAAKISRGVEKGGEAIKEIT